MPRKSHLLIGSTLLLLGGCSHNQKKDDAPRPPVAMKASSMPKSPVPQPTPQAAPVASTDAKPESMSGDAVYFDFDSALLRDDAHPVLQHVAKEAQASHANLRIEGNCDERGTIEYNLALGQQRAEAAKKYLTQMGVPASHISTVSWGSRRPKAEGHDENAWSENRRDDIKRQ